jgi:hypothetical protein
MHFNVVDNRRYHRSSDVPSIPSNNLETLNFVVDFLSIWMISMAQGTLNIELTSSNCNYGRVSVMTHKIEYRCNLLRHNEKIACLEESNSVHCFKYYLMYNNHLFKA